MTRHISVFLLPFLLLLFSCQKESTGDKVPVSISFASRYSDTNDAADSEGMKTLRIIVAKAGTTDIVFNFKNPVNPDGTSNVNVDLLPDTYDFYFIANEASVSGLDLNNPDLSTLESTVLNADPDTYVASSGIPFGEVRKGVVVSEGNSDVFGNGGKINMERSVAKVSLNFTNHSGAEVNLQDLMIKGAKTGTGHLFKQTQDEQSGGQDLVFGNTTIPVEGSTVLKYIYPVSSASNFSLTGTWNEVPNSTPLKLSSIPRNTHVVFNIILKDEKLDVSYTVKPWDKEDPADIEYGDNTFAAELKTDKVYDVVDGAYQVVYGDASKSINFIFTPTKPLGGKWIANVTNGLDFEVVNTFDGSQASGYIDGQAANITVRAKRPFNVSENRETEFYITLIDGLDNRGEQIINPANNSGIHAHPGNTTRIKIRQVAPEQKVTE